MNLQLYIQIKMVKQEIRSSQHTKLIPNPSAPLPLLSLPNQKRLLFDLLISIPSLPSQHAIQLLCQLCWTFLWISVHERAKEGGGVGGPRGAIRVWGRVAVFGNDGEVFGGDL